MLLIGQWIKNLEKRAEKAVGTLCKMVSMVLQLQLSSSLAAFISRPVEQSGVFIIEVRLTMPSLLHSQHQEMRISNHLWSRKPPARRQGKGPQKLLDLHTREHHWNRTHYPWHRPNLKDRSNRRKLLRKRSHGLSIHQVHQIRSSQQAPRRSAYTSRLYRSLSN